jgi:hypothetical protein
MTQHASILLGRLAVRAQAGGPITGGGRVYDERSDIATGRRVVGQPPMVSAAGRAQARQRALVQAGPGRGGQCLLDRLAGQLVPERQPRAVADEQPTLVALVDRVGRLLRHVTQTSSRSGCAASSTGSPG